jgi:predicted O-methyltransferase YrrM
MNIVESLLRRLPYVTRLNTALDRLRLERDRFRNDLDHCIAENQKLETLADQYRLEKDSAEQQLARSSADLIRCRKEYEKLETQTGLERLEFESTRQQLAEMQGELNQYKTWVPPGHFLSPIPCPDEVRKKEAEIYAVPRTMPGINLREKQQLMLFDSLLQYYPEQPFPELKSADRRYWFENPAYSYSDALLLYCMIRHLRPKSIVEVGSGFSSCAILDTNELFFANSISCTFIDPNPQRLLSLIWPDDKDRVTIVEKNLQDTDLELFTHLSAGDILFIDSSHVSKIDSDVNFIFFKLLPSLNSGVYIHMHDIFYPFEYPLDWVYEGRAWNEAYLLRAFLQYNDQFEVQLFNTFIDWFHKEKYFREMPLVKKNTGGNIWLRKL